MISNFDRSQFYALLQTLPFPCAHTVFAQPQTAPYLIYLDDEFEITAADSKNVFLRTSITLELYTKSAQTDAAEAAVETLLDTFTTYEKARSFLSDDKLYITYYNFTI